MKHRLVQGRKQPFILAVLNLICSIFNIVSATLSCILLMYSLIMVAYSLVRFEIVEAIGFIVIALSSAILNKWLFS